MARKYTDPKDFFNIVKKYIYGINVAKIFDEYKDKYSWSTVYRIATGNHAANTIGYLRQIVINSRNFDDFIKQTWKYFPFPEYWPTDKLCTMIQYSATHEYSEIVDRFGLKFKVIMLRKIFENGAIKKAAKTKCIKSNVTIEKPRVSVAEIEVIETDKHLIVAELIEQLKQLTGAKEIIIKV